MYCSRKARFKRRIASLLLVGQRIQRLFKKGSNLFVVLFLGQDSMSIKDSASVGIYDEYSMIACLQENRIGCFRPNSIQSEQLLA